MRRFMALALVAIMTFLNTYPVRAVDNESLANTWHWRELIEEAAHHYDLPAGLIQATMAVESGGNAGAHSWAGAIGLMQVMPRWFHQGENPWDPWTNVMKGASILRDCEDKAGGWYPGDDWVPAINCYLFGYVIRYPTQYSNHVRSAWARLAADGA